MGGYKHNSSFWDNRAGRDAPPCFASRPLKRGYEALAPPSIAPSPPGLPPQIGPFYARFQPILGTQKCFPRDFRDQFSVFPKISWTRGLFFKNMVRILGGAKGRFCPVAGGGGRFVSRSRCPVLRSGPVPGVPGGRRAARLDHYRRTLQARPGVDLSGPASDLARVGWLYRGFLALRDFWPCRASLLPCTALSLPGWPVVPARCRSWPVGLVRWPCWAVGGWFGLPAGLRCLFGADGVPVQFIPALSLDVCPASLRACPVWACFGPSGASSGFVWCPVVVWCFSSSTGQKKNGPVWVVSPWVCGGVSSTGILLAGLAWIRSRYAGRASPL